MKYFLSIFLLGFNIILLAQNAPECEKLSIKIHGLIDSEKSPQLLIEASNAMYAGHLYYYPGFLLINQAGDTIAKENVTYYGIGTNFQTHILELKDKISFPFHGRLELHGSYYQNFFCSFPIEIAEADYVSFKDIKHEKIKIGSTFNENHLILDLGENNINAEKIDYHFNITNEDGEIVHEANINTSCTSIPFTKFDKKGIYYISVWNGINKKLLPTISFEIE